jgi:hypothetical protein
MKKLLIPGLLLIIASTLTSKSLPLSSNLFFQKDKEGTETYQCIQIHRGDIITLTGNIEIADSKTESDQKDLYFNSLGGRTFLLKGDMLYVIVAFYQTINNNITLIGKVLFEGREDQHAELEVLKIITSNKEY